MESKSDRVKLDAVRYGIYATLNVSKYDRLNTNVTVESHLGVNCFVKGHQGKLTLDLANRPQVLVFNNALNRLPNLWQAVLQYQIYLN
jgi:hypothetical protein